MRHAGLSVFVPRGAGRQGGAAMNALFAEPLTRISFTVYGKPVPQGSSKAFYVKSLGRSVITTDNKKLKPWRQQVTDTAMAVQAEAIPDRRPVSIGLRFYFARPKSAKKRVGMIVKPDIDKLVRSILDALTGVLFQDDSQVVSVVAEKFYGDVERVENAVQEASS